MTFRISLPLAAVLSITIAAPALAAEPAKASLNHLKVSLYFHESGTTQVIPADCQECLFNTTIGEGFARAPSNMLLVEAEVITSGDDYSKAARETKLVLVAKAGGKVVAQQTFLPFAHFSKKTPAKVTMPMFVYDATNGDYVISATLVGPAASGTKVATQKVTFGGGE